MLLMEGEEKMNHFERFIKLTQNSLEDESEVLIVEKIIENLDSLYTLNLSDLANQCYISPTSIIRFIQRLDFESYSDFKEKVYLDYLKSSLKNQRPIICIQDSIDLQLKNLNVGIQNMNIQRMIDLAKLILSAKSVLLVGNERYLEDFQMLKITISAYDIPCFKYNRLKSFFKHVSLLTEDDLVLYIQNEPVYEQIIKVNPKPKKALLQVNSIGSSPFSEEETYLLINGGNQDESILLLGQIFYYFITYVASGGIYE